MKSLLSPRARMSGLAPKPGSWCPQPHTGVTNLGGQTNPGQRDPCHGPGLVRPEAVVSPGVGFGANQIKWGVRATRRAWFLDLDMEAHIQLSLDSSAAASLSC